MKTACKPHSNGPCNGGLCLDRVWSSEVYFRVQWCGRRSFFSFFLFLFNQQPLTLFEFYCSFLRTGTGLEIEAEFRNPESRGYCMLVAERSGTWACNGSRVPIASTQICWQRRALFLAACFSHSVRLSDRTAILYVIIAAFIVVLQQKH